MENKKQKIKQNKITPNQAKKRNESKLQEKEV